MGKRIVIALGGNALGENLPEQMAAVKQTARAIADLIQEGHQVVIADSYDNSTPEVISRIRAISRSAAVCNESRSSP